MKRMRTESLKPRKKPQQRRSRATIDTLFEAAIQVLLANGLDKITAIQIADRAGVSIGTLYQYFPNRRALAVPAMLMTASDAAFVQPQWVAGVLISSIVGPTRATIEAGGDRNTYQKLKLHLTALSVGYLKEMSITALN